jgi:DNA processing protein
MSVALTETQAWLILNGLPDIGPITTRRLLADMGGDPLAIFAAPLARLEQTRGVGPKISGNIVAWAERFDLAREEARMAAGGIAFVPAPDGAGYPPLLRELADAPLGLYQKGQYSVGSTPCVAIVGSRRTTLYGQAVAKKLGGELARLGFCVVSGLARGIDTAAHEGALAAGGRTVAVLGNGIDIVYPPENLALYRRIEEAGALLSEFPIGRRADKQSFAMRNRIVAGMSRAIIVVESDVAGGSMITAKFAGEQGRLVFAVPGRIDQPSSAGCHQLIRDGATLCTGVDDVLAELNYLEGFGPAGVRPIPMKGGAGAGELADLFTGVALPRAAERAEPHNLSPDEASVWAKFAGGALLGLDELTALTALPVARVSAALMMLELKRVLAKRADSRFEAR